MKSTTEGGATTMDHGSGDRPTLPDRLSFEALWPGDVIDGKYLLDRVLGRGGMGVVVAATHIGLDEGRASKFMRSSTVADAESVERFFREARACARRGLGEVILGCLTFDRERRPADVGALARALLPFAGVDTSAVMARIDGHLAGAGQGAPVSVRGAPRSDRPSGPSTFEPRAASVTRPNAAAPAGAAPQGGIRRSSSTTARAVVLAGASLLGGEIGHRPQAVAAPESIIPMGRLFRF